MAAYDGQFSPNARWVAYTSKESGREEVYVVPFDAARVLNTISGSAGASGSGKWQISASGGRRPRWRGDDKEIFYLSPDNQMMAAEVEGAGQWHRSADRAGPLQSRGRRTSHFPPTTPLRTERSL